jgi:hypothetical protein
MSTKTKNVPRTRGRPPLITDPGDRAKIKKAIWQIKSLGFSTTAACVIVAELINGNPSPAAIYVLKLARKLHPNPKYPVAK